LHLISPSGILTNVCLGTSWTYCVYPVFFVFFVFLVYCTAVLLVFLSWTNKRITRNDRLNYYMTNLSAGATILINVAVITECISSNLRTDCKYVVHTQLCHCN